MKNLTKEDREKLYKYSNEENIQKKLEIIADLYSRNQDNYKIMFKFLVTLGKFEEYRPRAKELLKDLVGKVNPSAIYFEIGKLDVLDKDLEGAVKNFEESLFYNERNTGSKLELAKVYRYMRRLEDAKSMLYNLLKSTDDGAAYYELGVISEIEGKDKRAEDYYQKSLTIRKSDIRALFKIGKIKRKNGDYEEAKKYFKEIYQRNKNDNYNLLELGKCEYALGNFDDARKYYNEALEIKKDPAVFIELALIEQRLDNYEEAYKYYLEANKIEHNSYTDYSLGIFEKSLGNYEKSIEYFEKCKEEKVKEKVYLSLSNLYIKTGDNDIAYEMFKKVDLSSLKVEKERKDYYRLENYFEVINGLCNESTCNNYFTRQLLNYDEGAAIELSRHSFSNTFDLESHMDKIKDGLKEENLSNTKGCQDFYIINMDSEIEDVYGRKTDKIMAITLINTDKIISIIPTIREKLNIHEDGFKRKRD